MRSEPFQGIGVALAQVAAGAGRNQIFPRRDASTRQRPDVVERVSIGAAIGAVGAPVGEDPAPEPGLVFAFRYQLSPVDVVVEHAESVIPTDPGAALPDAQVDEAFRRAVTQAVGPLPVTPVLHRLDVGALNVEVHSSHAWRVE